MMASKGTPSTSPVVASEHGRRWTKPPEPFDALNVPEFEPTGDQLDALGYVIIAVNGSIYAGERADAIALAVRWLRTQPELCEVLGLGKGVV